MGNIILLELEEDIRLAAVIVARNRNITLKAYKDYKEYEKDIRKDDVVYSSNKQESDEHNFFYIKKPYTAHELLQLINGDK